MPEPKLHPKVRSVIEAYRGAGNQGVASDVNGSYTGCSHDGGRPVQDADDL